jgi:uncharacterized protein YjiS (DUF1127 family)
MKTTASMTSKFPVTAVPTPRTPRAHGRGIFGSFFGTLLAWQERAEHRYRLAELDAHQLQDMGLKAEEVQRELHKPFWRA